MLFGSDQTDIMSKEQVLQLLHGSTNDDEHSDYRRNLLEKVRTDGWYATVNGLATTLSTSNLEAVDSALIEYLSTTSA